MKRLLLTMTMVGVWLTGSAQCPPTAPLSTPYTENFDGMAIGQFGSFSNCYVGTTVTPRWETEALTSGNSTGTGPLGDVCDNATGNYIYLETSGGALGDTGTFIIPALSTVGLTNPELSFSYHMFGATIGTLDVLVNTGTTWNLVFTLSGQQQTAETSPWADTAVSLSAYVNDTIEIKFRASRGSSFTGDISIDAISVDNPPTCIAPTNLAWTTVTSSSADLSWTAAAGATNGYKIIYGPAGFNPATGGTVQTATGTTITLSGLTAATSYDAYILSDCGAINGESDTSTCSVTFITGCLPFTAPYTRNFDLDADNAPAVCWVQYNNYNGAAYARVETPSAFNATLPFSGLNFLEMFSSSGGTTADTLMAVSPEFSDLTASNKQIKFQAAAQNINDVLYIATTSSQTPGSAYTIIDTITFATANTWQFVIVPFNASTGYNGTDDHIVFLHSLNTTFSDIYIDNFEYELIPACSQLTTVTLNSAGVTNAAFSYTGGGTTVQYEWGAVGFTQGTGTTGTLSGNPFTINGLLPGTCVDVYFRNDCSASGNGSSIWTGPVTVCTQCLTQTLPYSENWDANLGCFTVIDAGNTTDTWRQAANGSGTSGAGTGLDGSPGFVEADSDDAGSGAVTMFETLLSPMVDASGVTGTLYLEFDQFYQHLGAGKSEVDVWDGTTWVNLLSQNANVGSFATPDHQKIDVSAYANDSLQVRFVYDDGGSWAWWWVLDNFLLQEEFCNRSTNFTTNFVTADSVGLGWTPGGGVNFLIEYGPTGFAPGTGTTVSTTNSSLTITGLTGETLYDFYLIDSCADGATSIAVPLTVKTACAISAAAILPLVDGFENYTAGPTFTSGDYLCNPGYYWELQPAAGSGRIRLQAGTAWYNSGAQAITMDHDPFTSTIETNFLTMTVNLSNYTSASGIELGFSIMDHGAPSHPNNKVWARGTAGAPWIEIADLNILTTGIGFYDSISNIDIVAPLATAGQSVSATTQIRFGEAGQSGTSFGVTCCDGFSFDDVSLTAVSCPQPGTLAANGISDSAATLAWTGSSSTSNYQYWFGPAGFFQGTSTMGGAKGFTTNSSILVDTLSAQSCYEFLVRSSCSPGDTSLWAGPFVFCTPCSPISAPYFEDWDLLSSSSKDVGCFSSIEDPSLNASTFQGVTIQAATFTNPISSPNVVELDNGSSLSPLALVSPPTTDMTAGDKRIVFYTRASFVATPPGNLIVGTMSDPFNAATFNAIDTIPLNGTAYTQQIVNLTTNNGYNGTDNHFAFVHDQIATFRTYYIDDVTYEQIPTCPEVANLAVLNVDTMNAEITFDPFSGSAGSFEIEYGDNPLGSAANSSVIVNNDTTTLSSLIPGTNYCFWVREICTPGDTSNWTGPVCFKTNCVSISALYIENWDSRVPNFDLGCFSKIEDASLAPSAFQGITLQNSTFNAPLSAPNYVEMDNGFTNTPLILVSPETSDLTAGDKRVEFWARESFANAPAGKIIVGTMSSPSDAATFNPIDTITLTGASPFPSYVVEFTTATGYNGTDRYFAFRHDQAGNFRTYYIDDIVYEVIPTCPRPSGIAQDSADLTSITASWTANGTGTSWVIEYGPVGFTPGSGTTAIATTNPYTITGLTAATAYDVYVSEICGPGDTSRLVGPEQMSTTVCAASSQCWFYFDLTDSFGDGWNGAEVEIRQNGVAVATLGSNFTTGTLYQDSVLLCDGFPTTVVVTDLGSWGSEIGIVVTTPFGTNAGTYNNSPTTALGTVMVSFSSNCTPPTCNAPSALALVSSSLTSMDVSWTSNGTGSSWEVEYGPAGFTPGNGTSAIATASPYSITGLATATAYDVYVREICGPGDTSSIAGPLNAGTSLCNASSQCAYILDLTDSFGDGWNGAIVTVYQNGVEVGQFGSGFTTGSLFTDTVYLCDSLPTSIVLTNAGSWPSEVGINVFDPSGASAGSYANSPSTSVNDTLVSFTTNCAGAPAPCADPTGLTVTNNVGCANIEVDWVSNTGGSLIEYGPAGFSLGTGSITGVVTAPYNITGLSPATSYDVYIADTCSSDTSGFVLLSASTASGPLPTASFTIDSAIVGSTYEVYLNASASTNATSYAWSFGNGGSSNAVIDTAIFLGNGSYTITLIVTNACGSDTMTFNTNVNIGIGENALANSLNVYPNPASYQVNISFNAISSGDATIRLLDVQGREIIRDNANAAAGKFMHEIDVTGLASGIYMIEIQSGDLMARRRVSIK
jgi:hypothetical protein